MIALRQSTASQEVPLGYFLDSSDGNTEETGLSIANTDIKIWKWGATTLGNKNSGGATHISNGIYYCTLDATDTDTLGPLVIFVHVSGALTVRLECEVLPGNVWDSKYSTDKLEVDVTAISGDSAAADNLEAACDGGSYNLGGGAMVAASVSGAVGSVTGNVGGNVVGSVASVTAGVTLANGAHGGAAAVLTLKQLYLESTDSPALYVHSSGGATGSVEIDGDSGVDCVTLSGGDMGLRVTNCAYGVNITSTTNPALHLQSASGNAVYVQGGNTILDDAIRIVAQGTGCAGINISAADGDGIKSVGTGGYDINADIHGTIDACTTNTDMRGTDSAATAAALSAHDAKLDTVDGIVDAILVDTAQIGAAGAGLTAVPWNAAWDAEVQSECADALAAYDPPTKAEMDSGHALLATPAQVNAQVLDVMDVDTLIDTKTIVEAIQYVAASAAGIVSGAGTGTEVFKGLDKSTTRLTVTVDGSGNRSGITYG